MTRVLVTGANGFIGGAIARHLLAQGWQVRGCLRRAGIRLPDGIEPFVSGDIDGGTNWQAALENVDAIVHCAARVHVLQESASNPLAAFRRVNVEGSHNLARQAQEAGVARLVFLSSIGASEAEGDLASASPYQLSKLEAEAALGALAAGGPMTVVMLRPPLVYGPGAPGNFRRLARLIEAGRPLPLAAIRNRRSLLYVGNLATAVEAALTSKAAPAAPLALADGEALSTPELARRIGAACGRKARLFPCPASVLRLAGRLLGRGAAIEALTASLPVDNAAIHKSLGWSPTYSVDQGLAETFRTSKADPSR